MSQRLLLPLLLIVLAGLGVGFWWAFGGDPAPPAEGLGPGPGPVITSSAPVGLEPGLPDARGRDDRDGGGDVTSTVVIPLEITLELVEATGRLAIDGKASLGHAASARIRGSMFGYDGRPLNGQVKFIAGPNTGRILEVDSSGAFGANDLYAGISLVRLTGPGAPGAEREVLLREKRETPLNIGFGSPATVTGQVKDTAGNPVPQATVFMDGQKTQTDERGNFYFPRMTSGKVPIYITKPGYASQRESQEYLTYVTAGGSVPKGKLQYTLRPGATLKVSVPERLGVGRPGLLYLSGPLEPGKMRRYPWHLKSPVTIYGGETVEIDDLPAGAVRVQLFIPGTKCVPKTQSPVLAEGDTKEISFHLKPAAVLRGKVTLGGKAVSRALVQLEAPDVTDASVKALDGNYGRAKIEMEMMGLMPPALQRVRTGDTGGFQFSAGEELAPTRYLTARSADGRAWAGRVVRSGEREVELKLESVEEGLGSLVFETTERTQGLPVKYTVNGKPASVMLPRGERLVIEDLPEGRWRYSARWGTEVVQAPTPLLVKDSMDLFVPLPKGAVEGQSKALRDAMQ